METSAVITLRSLWDRARKTTAMLSRPGIWTEAAFSDACSRELTIENTDTGDDSIVSFSEKLLAIAADSIPKSKPGKRSVNTLWFNNDCKAAVQSRRKALKKATVSPSSENNENYRIIRAKSRRTIRSSRRQSCLTFVSKINSRTSLKKVWNLVSKISGKNSPTAVHHLNVNNNEITWELDIANTSNSSTDRQKAEKRS